MQKFISDVDQWVSETEERLTAVFRESVQRVIDKAQLPVAKGGHMRVDTGFLRASGNASLSGLPSGPKRYEGALPVNEVALVIGQAALGDAIWFGWTAEYAKYREAYDGFLVLAVQDWGDIVHRVIIDLKGSIIG